MSVFSRPCASADRRGSFAAGTTAFANGCPGPRALRAVRAFSSVQGPTRSCRARHGADLALPLSRASRPVPADANWLNRSELHVGEEPEQALDYPFGSSNGLAKLSLFG